MYTGCGCALTEGKGASTLFLSHLEQHVLREEEPERRRKGDDRGPGFFSARA